MRTFRPGINEMHYYSQYIIYLIRKESFKTLAFASFLGFGHGCFSHAFGTKHYYNMYPLDSLIEGNRLTGKDVESTGKNLSEVFHDLLERKYKKGLRHVGFKINEGDEMRTVAYSNFWTLRITDFQEIPFTEKSKTHLSILWKLRMIVIEGDRIRFFRHYPIPNRIARRYLMSKDFIFRMIRVPGEEYDPSLDYLEKVRILNR